MISATRTDIRVNASEVSLIRFLDGICAALIAICPLLQHYKGLKLDVSSELLILFFPYIVDY